jgi:hypothetical protein
MGPDAIRLIRLGNGVRKRFLSAVIVGSNPTLPTQESHHRKDEVMDGNSLDRHITGNYGEDSVTPDFVKAHQLGDFGLDGELVIDISLRGEGADEEIPVTVTEVRITSGLVYLHTKELAYQLVLTHDEIVWFASQ